MLGSDKTGAASPDCRKYECVTSVLTSRLVVFPACSLMVLHSTENAKNDARMLPASSGWLRL